MKPSQNCINLIKECESFSAIPYIDVPPNGTWTIGYGTTYLPNGVKVNKYTPKITESQACDYLMDALNKVAIQINNIITAKLNQNQFDAVCSFVYNIKLKEFKTSVILKEINANPFDPDIKKQFSRWIFSKGEKLNGLVDRRQKEANLYFKT